MPLYDPKTGEELDYEALKAAARPGPKVGGKAGKRVNYTAKNRTLLDVGIHPATRLRLLGAPLRTCSDCEHCVRVHGGNRLHWKCEKHRLGMSRSEASDIRVGWPACTAFEPRADEPDD